MWEIGFTLNSDLTLLAVLSSSSHSNSLEHYCPLHWFIWSAVAKASFVAVIIMIILLHCSTYRTEKCSLTRGQHRCCRLRWRRIVPSYEELGEVILLYLYFFITEPIPDFRWHSTGISGSPSENLSSLFIAELSQEGPCGLLAHTDTATPPKSVSHRILVHVQVNKP
jgi:hypothetical protein